jgi:hypothetical protein
MNLLYLSGPSLQPFTPALHSGLSLWPIPPKNLESRKIEIFLLSKPSLFGEVGYK